MSLDPISFSGGTHLEVIAVLARCGDDTKMARQALVAYIQHKQKRGRSTEHISAKFRDLELRFIQDESLRQAFRDARKLTGLPDSPDRPLASAASWQKRISSISDRAASNVPSTVTDSGVSIGPSSDSARSARDFLSSTSLSSPAFVLHRSLSDTVSTISAAGDSPSCTQTPRMTSPLAALPSPPRSSLEHNSQPLGPFTSGPRPVTPPRPLAPTAPPRPFLHVDTGWDSPTGTNNATSAAEHPSRLPPMQPPSRPLHTATRPLPIQPFSAPIPEWSESNTTLSSVGQPYLQGYSTVPYSATVPSGEVLREEGSPVYDISPPPYVDVPGGYSPLDSPAIGDRLSEALITYDVSPEVEQVVLRCLKLCPGYEPVFWYSHLLACNVNQEAARYLVDEMWREVSRRSIT